MKITDVFSAKALAFRVTQNASRLEAYLGLTLFPFKKKLGLDLKWFLGSLGLPISLSPATFDTKDTIRARNDISKEETEMALFRESMKISERDEQEIMRVQEASDPYAQQVVDHIYRDADELVEGAYVVPERMIMQLLAPTVDGSPRINIAANGVTYTYNYDPNGKYQKENCATVAVSWSDTSNATPLTDVQTAIGTVYKATGVRPTNLLVSAKTMGYLVSNAQIRSAILAQNATANIFMTKKLVKQIFMEVLGVSVIEYNKMFKTEGGVPTQFYPDEFATLFPDGALGNTWFGTTPEERTLIGNSEANVHLVGDTGITVTVSEKVGPPVETLTTVSEVVLPSYERMYETFALNLTAPVVPEPEA